MDKIWYRNPSKSEVIGRCGEDEKTEWPHKTDKSRTPKKALSYHANWVISKHWSFFLYDWKLIALKTDEEYVYGSTIMLNKPLSCFPEYVLTSGGRDNDWE